MPNVLYTCGAIIHNDELVIPYSMSDMASGIAVISVKDLLSRFRTKGKLPDICQEDSGEAYE